MHQAKRDNVVPVARNVRQQVTLLIPSERAHFTAEQGPPFNPRN